MTDLNLISILRGVDVPGHGPDAPLFSADDLSKLEALPSSEKQLLQLVADPSADQGIRFVSAEALVEGNWMAWREDAASRRAVADVLAVAMASDRIHNRWGLPGSFVGPFGQRLLSLGTDAQAALRPLLSDLRPLHIVGSEAATLNSQANFRVSDLAAWLIASARQIPWNPSQSPAERDTDIRNLQSQI